jgi:hypothetical protein
MAWSVPKIAPTAVPAQSIIVIGCSLGQHIPDNPNLFKIYHHSTVKKTASPFVDIR